jgi:hypothetical protein
MVKSTQPTRNTVAGTVGKPWMIWVPPIRLSIDGSVSLKEGGAGRTLGALLRPLGVGDHGQLRGVLYAHSRRLRMHSRSRRGATA